MLRKIEHWDQGELFSLLTHQVALYNGGNTSLRAEKAQELLQSILFTLSFAEKKTLAEQFAAGQKRIFREVHIGRARYYRLLEQPPEIFNVTLEETVCNLAGFFRHYDVYFSAHEIPCDIDYPLLYSCWELEGIRFINTYIQRLQWENSLCDCFSPETRRNIYANYALAGAWDHLNLAEPLLMGGIKALILEQNPREPDETVLLKGLKPNQPLTFYAKELCRRFELKGTSYFEAAVAGWEVLL